jgi:hypothetical protein
MSFHISHNCQFVGVILLFCIFRGSSQRWQKVEEEVKVLKDLLAVISAINNQLPIVRFLRKTKLKTILSFIFLVHTTYWHSASCLVDAVFTRTQSMSFEPRARDFAGYIHIDRSG